MSSSDVLFAVGRLLIGGLFLAAGLAKARAPSSARSLVGEVFSAPPRTAALGTAVLAIVEIAIGVTLISGVSVGLVLIMAESLLFVFTAVLVRLHRRGYQGGCACFGAHHDRPIGRLTIVRNLVLLVATGVLFGLYRSGADSHLLWDLPPAVPVIATLAGLTATLLAACVDSVAVTRLARKSWAE